LATDWRKRLSDAYDKLLRSDKRVRLLVIIGLAGVLLLVLSELLPHADSPVKANKKSDTETQAAYLASLEEETATLLSSIEGVGRCRVMITLKSSGENVYAKNSQENRSDSSYSGSYEYVLYDDSDGEAPVLLKEYLPAVQGVAVVCDGADNAPVRENVVNSVSALFNISVSRISVSKYKN